MERCIGCGTCETICQNEAIDLAPADRETTDHGDSGLRPIIDYGRCCWCALCVDACPTGSLGMSNQYQWVATDPGGLRYIPGKDAKPWDDSPLGYNHENRSSNRRWKPGDSYADAAGTPTRAAAVLVDASSGTLKTADRSPDAAGGPQTAVLRYEPGDQSNGYRLLAKSRVPMPMIDPEEGVVSSKELVLGYSREQAILEADRCVQCGLCTATCPAHMNVPGYIRSILDEDLPAGMRIVYESNPLPASCGRVCSHACEYVCSKGHNGGEPISIRWLKRYIVDQIYSQDYQSILPHPEEKNEKRLAIIGSGPAGLATAYYLRLLGYQVTVFDAQDKPGGMLRYGIPEYRLPYEQIEKDIGYIKSLGVEVRQEVRVGVDTRFDEIYAAFDVVFFSTGLSSPYQIGVPGQENPRVLSGLRILDDVTNGRDPGIGRRVAVIGGETWRWTRRGLRGDSDRK
jgi:glutamate synthase (NADPH/NADH) small chain